MSYRPEPNFATAIAEEMQGIYVVDTCVWGFHADEAVGFLRHVIGECPLVSEERTASIFWVTSSGHMDAEVVGKKGVYRLHGKVGLIWQSEQWEGDTAHGCEFQEWPC
jgi:hypothetical protein